MEDQERDMAPDALLVGFGKVVVQCMGRDVVGDEVYPLRVLVSGTGVVAKFAGAIFSFGEACSEVHVIVIPNDCAY